MIAVTGAAGLLGSNLIRGLLAEGKPARAIIRNDARGLDGLDVEICRADVRDRESLRIAMEGVETVFHLAAMISLRLAPDQAMWDINVLGTRNVVDVCMELGIKRLIHFSSIHALKQAPLDEVLDERRALVSGKNTSSYDLSKAMGEREVLAGCERGLDAIILNPTAVIGPWDYRPSYLGAAMLAIRQGRMPALVSGGFDWVDGRDVALGAIQASKHGKSGERYILSGNWRSVRQLAELVMNSHNGRAPTITVPLWLAYGGLPFRTMLGLRARYPFYTFPTLKALESNRSISHLRATEEFGYAPRPFEETVRDTMTWFEKHAIVERGADRA